MLETDPLDTDPQRDKEHFYIRATRPPRVTVACNSESGDCREEQQDLMPLSQPALVDFIRAALSDEFVSDRLWWMAELGRRWT